MKWIIGFIVGSFLAALFFRCIKRRGCPHADYCKCYNPDHYSCNEGYSAGYCGWDRELNK